MKKLEPSSGHLKLWIHRFHKYFIVIFRKSFQKILPLLIFGICFQFLNLIFLFNSDLIWTTTALAILSKLFITGTFGVIYLHTCELYPTCVRNSALGSLATFAKVGGFLSPYIMMAVSSFFRNYDLTVVHHQWGVFKSWIQDMDFILSESVLF